MTSAYVYLRVSGLAQVEGDGFERQLLACQKYAAAHDIEIVKVFREEGVTGKSELDDRPALQELIADLLSNGTRLFLIEKLDRLARKLIVQETILQDLQRRGIKIISVAEPDLIDDDPTRTLIRQILGSFFEYERKMIVSKLRSARERIKAKHGQCEGVRGFGRDPERPEEVPTLERIMRLHRMGDTVEQIASSLNADLIQWPTRTGNNQLWTASTLRKIIRREKTSPKYTPTEVSQ